MWEIDNIAGYFPGLVEQIHHAPPVMGRKVGIPQCHLEVAMTQQLPHSVQISPCLHETRCKVVAQIVESEIGNAGSLQ